MSMNKDYKREQNRLISLYDIEKIIRKETEEDDDLREKQKRLKYLSPYAQSFQMFKDRMPLEYVAIELDLDADIVLHYYEDYLNFWKMDWLFKIYNYLNRFSCILLSSSPN